MDSLKDQLLGRERELNERQQRLFEEREKGDCPAERRSMLLRMVAHSVCCLHCVSVVQP